MSATLTEAREALADALNSVQDVHVRARGAVRSPRQGDGWVTVGRLTPDDYTRCSATLTAIVVLGSDEDLAEQLLDTWAVQLLDAATKGDLPAAEVFAEPLFIPVDGGGAVYALTITMTTEVEP
jgi:hypothetical protein